MNRKTKAKILLGAFIVSGILSQMSAIFPLHAMVTDDDDAATPSAVASTGTDNTTSPAASEAAPADDKFPLHTAALNGNLEQLKVSISHIKYARDRDIAINTQDSDGDTVLHCAIFSKNVELIKWLCEHYDFNPAIKTNKGFTPLDLMDSIGRDFIIELAQNYSELAKAQSSERTSASADKLTACHSSAGVSDPNKITTLSPLTKLREWLLMKDVMKRIAKIRKLVEQRNIDAIAPLVDKYVLNVVIDGIPLTEFADNHLNAPLMEKLFKCGVLTTPDDLYSALRTAAYRDNLDLFKQIIEKVPADDRVAMLNRKTAMHQRNILHLALLQRTGAQVAKYILDNYDGVDLNDADVCHDTPASLALKHHHFELIALMVIKGARCNTNLHDAAFSNKLYSFVRVLSHIPDSYRISMLNTQTREGNETVLHTALIGQNLPVAMYIIENYAIDLNKQDEAGNTPLDIAIKKNFTSIADLLRVRGAVANTTLPRNIPLRTLHTLDSHTYDIYSNILHSVYDGDLDGLRYILSTLSNYDQIKLLKVTNILGYTVLHQAASKNHFEIVKYILDNYDVDINAQAHSEETPLDLAIERGYIEIAQLLRTHGATCSAENSRKYDDFIEKNEHSWSRFWKRLFAHPMDQNDM